MAHEAEASSKASAAANTEQIVHTVQHVGDDSTDAVPALVTVAVSGDAIDSVRDDVAVVSSFNT